MSIYPTYKPSSHKPSHIVDWKAFSGKLLLGFLVSLGSAFCAALLGSLVGPSLQILMNAHQTSLTAEEAFGPHIGGVLAGVFHMYVWDREEWLGLLPQCLFVMALFKSSCSFLHVLLWENISEWITRGLRSRVVSSFIHMYPPSREQIRHVEEALAGQMSGDMRMVREYMLHVYGGLPREALQICFLGTSLYMLSPYLCCVFFFAMVPAGVWIRYIGKRIKKKSKLALNEYAELSEWIQQRLLGAETIKHSEQEAWETQKFETYTAQLRTRVYRAIQAKARTGPMVEFCAVLGVMVLFFFAIKGVQTGKFTSAVVISFLSTLMLMSQALNTFARYFNAQKEGKAALQRIKGTLDVLHAHVHASVHTHMSTAGQSLLHMEGVSVHMTDAAGRRQCILDEIHLHLKRGRIYLVQGASGGGKTTLLRTMLGLTQISSGQMLWHIPKHHIGYVPQELELFEGSIAQNIAYPDHLWEPEALRRSLMQVGLSHVYDAPDIGASGQGLSGGQAQRLFMARLFYFKFPLVIIDEGTSALDGETEGVVLEALQQLKQQHTTVFMVAHKSSAIKIADEVYTMQGGKLYATPAMI